MITPQPLVPRPHPRRTRSRSHPTPSYPQLSHPSRRVRALPSRLASGITALVLALLSAFAVPGVSAVAAAPVRTDAEDRLDSLLNALETPHARAVVVSSVGIEAQAAGDPPEGDGTAPPAATRWGSVSKGVTGHLVVTLVEEGRIDLDTEVGTVLTELPDATGRLTVRQLLTHTSGLPHDLAVTDRDRPSARAVDVLGELPAPDAAASGFTYASTNYIVLQALVERVTGEEFPATVAATGAVSAGTGPDGQAAGHGCARPARIGSAPFAGLPMAAPATCDGAGLGYGYLTGDLSDLARWAQWNLSPEGAAFHARSREAAAPTGPDSAYGFGWNYDSVDLDGTAVERIHHSGAIPGTFTRVELLPALDRAVVIVVDEYGEPGSADLARTASSAATAVFGSEPPAPARSATYPLALGAVGIAVIGTVSWLGVVLLRPARVPTRTVGRSSERSAVRTAATRFGISAVLCAAAAAAMAVVLPATTGLGPAGLARWAPDLAAGGGLVVVALAAATVVAGLRLARAARV